MVPTAEQSEQDTASLTRVQRIYDIWGRHSALYALQDWLTFLGRHRKIRRLAAVAMGIGAGADVLEVACGTGRNFPYIETMIGPEGRLVGFDYSESMLEAARNTAGRHNWKNIQLIQGDSARLEVEDSSFDGVLTVLALSAIPDHMNTLRRIHDVLRPGGKLAICDARKFSGWLRILNPLARLLYVRSTNWHPERDIVAAVTKVFGSVSVRHFNFGTLFIASAMNRGSAHSQGDAE